MSPELLKPLLRRWEKRCPLSSADIDALHALPWSEQLFQREEYLVREGSIVKHCALILSGYAYRQKLLPDGARQIISIHIPGEFVDLQNSLLSTSDHNVQALARTIVAMVPAKALSDLAASNANIGRAMWMDTLLDASIFREWVVNVGRRDARARIAHLICEQAHRVQAAGLGQPERFDFPLTQEQLGDATGLTAVHTNRTLQALRRDGLLEYGAGSVRILDWPRLRQVGQFDELYLHHAA